MKWCCDEDVQAMLGTTFTNELGIGAVYWKRGCCCQGWIQLGQSPP